MGKGAKNVRVKKSADRKKISEKIPKISRPEENLEQLMRQKEEIEALLSSLEDAYSEASILEEDYNDIKLKNEKKLEDTSKKIDILTRKQEAAKGPETRPSPQRLALARMTRPQVELPVIEEIEEEEPAAEEKPRKEKKERAVTSIGPSVSQEDLKQLEVDLAEKIKDMVEGIGAKVTEKDLLEMKNTFAKFEADIDKMKAQVEAVREGKKADEEKIQRVAEGVAEIRAMVYGREASVKDLEIRMEKTMDVLRRLEPEKIVMELGRRDKEMGNQNLRLTKIEETTKEFGEMLKKIETLLRNVGSLEHVINVSNEASEKLMVMENIQRSNQKMLDKIQGIYAELSKRMEEFVLYRAKQDRVEDLMNDLMKNADELSTKAAYFITKDDLESFKASMQTATPSYSEPGESQSISSQKEEIEMLMKTIEDEFKSRAISKEEYEKMKNANLAKLKELENKAGKIPSPVPAPQKGIKPVKPAKTERKADEAKMTKETKSKNEMMLKDLEDTYKKGFISKEAYEKTKKMILGKR
jgi:DNA repair exonuclease SbcCD ATPase subunit